MIISDWATVGVYGFGSAALYQLLYEGSYQSGGVGEVEGERYVAPMYQMLLQIGKLMCASKLNVTDVHIRGTPRQVQEFDPLAIPPQGAYRWYYSTIKFLIY